MSKKNSITTADHFSYDEFMRFVDCLHKDQRYMWELYACMSFCTACRASDVLNLRWVDVLNKDKAIVCERKTQKARMIKFNASVKKKIEQLYRLLDSPEKYKFLFENKRTGQPLTIEHINATLKRFKYQYALKIGNFSTHTFRKTFGRYTYDQHPDKSEALLLLNRILNHSDVRITKAYIGITQNEIDSIYDSIAL